MPILSLPDADLAYELHGTTGPLVVQLHGLTSSRARDGEIGLDLTAPLAGTHRILRYDARGHGSSTGRPIPADYTWPQLAQDLLALLRHVAPGEQVHGVGPSMGSATLLHAAIVDPRRFRTLTLISPPTAWQTRRAQAAIYRENATLVDREGPDAFEALARLAPVVPALADAPRTNPTVAEGLLPAILRGAAQTDLPSPEVLARLEVPTLLLGWTGDPSHPVSTASRLAVLLRAGHLVVAKTPYGIMAWPGLFADHVVAHATA